MQIHTTHGRIDTTEKRYYCRRSPQHYFRKYQGFGLSVSEVLKMEEHGVTEVVLDYIGKTVTIRYNIPLEKIKTFRKYSFNGDIQYIMPEKHIRNTNPQRRLIDWGLKNPTERKSEE